MAPNLILNPTAVQQGYNGVTRAISNWVLTTDGRYMCCWIDVTTRELITGYSVDLDFLSVNYAIESVVTNPSIVVTRVDDSPTSLYKRDDGKVLLFIVNWDLDSWVKCYISASGNGDDWAFYSLVFESVTESMTSRWPYVAIPIRLPSGRLVLTFITGTSYYYRTINGPTCMCAISDNDGVSWTITHHDASYMVLGVGQVCLLPDGSMFFSWLFYTGNERLLRSLDSGVTWTQVASWDTTFANSGLHGWGMSYYYDPITATAYAHSSTGGFIAYLENPTGSNFSDVTAWTVLHQGLSTSGLDSGCRIYMIPGYLLFHTTSGSSYLYSSVPSAPISKAGRHAIYRKTTLGTTRIRNAQVMGVYPANYERVKNLKHKIDTNIWGGTTL